MATVAAQKNKSPAILRPAQQSPMMIPVSSHCDVVAFYRGFYGTSGCKAGYDVVEVLDFVGEPRVLVLQKTLTISNGLLSSPVSQNFTLSQVSLSLSSAVTN